MNILDTVINYISPKAAANRARYRMITAAYDAAKPNNQRKERPDNSSANLLTQRAGSTLRGYARNLEQNHDIAEGVLATLVNNVVGQNGINVEPMPRRKDGTLHTEFAKQLLKYFNDWKECPEVTWEHQWSDCERLLCRAWIRDGEAFVQFLTGIIPGLDHGTKVPMSIELIEADYLPFWNNNPSIGLYQSIERNDWGRARAYHVLKQHPEDITYKYGSMETRVIFAQNMLHLKLVKRFRQSRGVTVFATVMKRLEDLKDYEESERIAARVAAAMTSYIKQSMPADYEPPETSTGDRSFKIQPGLVFDGLLPGEDVGTIQSNRPSGLLGDFRDAMVRAVACGTGANASSVSKKYDGNYSAQRQELVESYANYGTLTDSFVGMITKPVFKKVIELGVLSGVIKIPKDLDLDTLYQAEYYGPKMPWIDPLKESRANQENVSAGFKSQQQVIRDNGGNPDAVLEQSADWKPKADEKGLNFSTFQPQAPQPVTNQPN